MHSPWLISKNVVVWRSEANISDLIWNSISSVWKTECLSLSRQPFGGSLTPSVMQIEGRYHSLRPNLRTTLGSTTTIQEKIRNNWCSTINYPLLFILFISHHKIPSRRFPPYRVGTLYYYFITHVILIALLKYYFIIIKMHASHDTCYLLISP